MKVRVARGGGIAGIVRETEIAADALPTDAAAELREMVERAGLQSGVRPASVTEAGAEQRQGGHPDETSYEVTLEDERGTRTVQVQETRLPAEIRELIAWIDSRPEREDALKPPGK